MSINIPLIERLRYANSLGLRYRSIAMLLFLQLASTLFEGIGVSMLLPLMELYSAGGDATELVARSPFWKFLADAFAYLNLPLTLLVLTVATAVMMSARLVFIFIHKLYKSRTVHGLLRDIRNRMFEKSLYVSIDEHDRTALGTVVNDVLVEADRAVGAINIAIMLVGMSILMVLYIGLLVSVSASLTALLLITVAFEGLLLRQLMRRTKRLGSAYTEANQNFSSYLTERLRSLRHIRMSGTEPAEMDTAKLLTVDQFRQAFGIAKVTALGNLITEFLVIATLFAFFYAGVSVFEMTLATLVVFAAMVLRVLLLIKMCLGKTQTMLAEFGGFDAVRVRLSQLEEKQEPDSGSLELAVLRDSIELKDVSFAYPTRDARPALEDVNLTIPVGKMTAVVGPSGAGKSTLIDLLPRLRDPGTGTILLDGRPAQEFKLSSLRRAISYVPQDPQLFNVTIGEHIRYGRSDASDQQVRDAAALAGAAEFIEKLPEGYETKIGEVGVELSGGQRQRLDMARALVRAAPILILDEPTSNLDADAEKHFRDSLQRIIAETNLTVIVVAHRLSTVSQAAQIAVMEAGRITSIGDHSELLARGGWYARAFSKQSGELAADQALDVAQ